MNRHTFPLIKPVPNLSVSRIPIVLLIILLSVLPVSVLAVVNQSGFQHGIMYLDNETLQKEDQLYRSMPEAQIPGSLMAEYAVSGEPQYKNLLPFVPYIPDERDQGNCGNCWVWAGTGVMEIAHKLNNSVYDRLSIQFLNSNYNQGTGDNWACKGHDITDFSNFYNKMKYTIPWSNRNAGFFDGNACPNHVCSGGTKMPASLIATNPRYDITIIHPSRVVNLSDNQSMAIQKIKRTLDQNKGVFLGLRLPSTNTWNSFQSFWNTKSEDNIWYMNSFENQPWGAGGGGHAVLVVGYNMTESDHKVVWKETYNPSGSAIKVKDLTSGNAQTVVSSTSAFEFESPAISGNRVVWKDTYNPSGPAIKVKDLTTGNAWTIVVKSLNSNCSVDSPAISGNKVAWAEHDYSNGRTAIKVKDITSSSAPTTVVQNYGVSSLAISGNKVVWDEGFSTIKVKDLASGTITTIVENGDYEVWHPGISGYKVVWYEYYFDGSTAIKVKDLTGSSAPTTVVSSGSGNSVSDPAISGNKVMWKETYGYGIGPSFKMKDLTDKNAPTTVLTSKSDNSVWIREAALSGSPSWLILNSWGAPSGRPKGLFRMSMDMDYSGIYQNKLLMDEWYTLDITFKPTLTAYFTANKTSGTAPLTIRFTDTSTGSPTTWNWTFGDGNKSTVRNPVFTYKIPGNYTVSLNVTRDGGFNKTVRTNYIVITPAAANSNSTITVVAPDGGNNWQRGSTHTIKWSYTGNPGSKVKIDLLKGTAVNRVINASTSIGSNGSGSYSWKIPSNQTLGTDYKIRITSTSNAAYTDKSNVNFTISV